MSLPPDPLITTTGGPFTTLLIRVERDEDGAFIVSDYTGVRYGYGKTIASAFDEWLDSISHLLEIKNAGGPLLEEINSYRNFLR